jgi:hypothetical protein
MKNLVTGFGIATSAPVVLRAIRPGWPKDLVLIAAIRGTDAL